MIFYLYRVGYFYEPAVTEVCKKHPHTKKTAPEAEVSSNLRAVDSIGNW